MINYETVSGTTIDVYFSGSFHQLKLAINSKSTEYTNDACFNITSWQIMFIGANVYLIIFSNR